MVDAELEHDDEKAALLAALSQLYWAWCETRGEVSDLSELPRRTSTQERELANQVCDLLGIQREDYEWENELDNDDNGC